MEIVFLALGGLALLLTLGGPLPFCFGLGLMVMHYLGGITMKGVLMYGLQQVASPVLLSIPMFVFAGQLMAESGIAKSLLDFVNIFVGRIKGGLGIVSIVTCAIIGAISGSSITGVSAVGPIMIPRMVKENYPPGFASALVSISSVLGLLIPPSISMLTYAWLTECSVLACFVSTVVPGLMIAFMLSVLNVYIVKDCNLVLAQKTTFAEKMKETRKSGFHALPALMMPVIILGGIYGGIMTTTEAAGVAVIYSLPIGFWVYRGLTRKTFAKSAINSAATVGSIMLLILLCTCLGQMFIMLGVPQKITVAILNFSSNKYVILLLVNMLFIVLGMLVTDLVSILLVVPLILPLMIEIGIDPVHFGAFAITNLSMGAVTPPYATVFYLGLRIGKTTIDEAIKPLLILILFAYLPVLLLTTFIPEISLALPRLLGLM
ncbi:TRAP transporter large permease [Synergistaceae bacterium OttesenSCG-928-I11]|nr:TRAP transporter large permease [Synergistaceae bacterium OttesenSCG-928-I11]